MPKYFFVYHGGMPRTRQEAQNSLTKWNDWFASLGARVVDRGAPAKNPRRVGQPGASAAPSVSGYSVVVADSEAAAVAIAESCPIHNEGGSVELASVVELR